MANIGFSSPGLPRTAPTASQKSSLSFEGLGDAYESSPTSNPVFCSIARCEEQPWWKFHHHQTDVSNDRPQKGRGPKNIHQESDWWFDQPAHANGLTNDTPGENGRDISAVDSKETIEGPKQRATAGAPCKEDAEFGKYFRRNSMQHMKNGNVSSVNDDFGAFGR